MNQETIDKVISLQNKRVDLIGHIAEIDRILNSNGDNSLRFARYIPNSDITKATYLRAEFLEDEDYTLFLDGYRDAVQHALIKIDKEISEL